jgi:hypothetical protein
LADDGPVRLEEIAVDPVGLGVTPGDRKGLCDDIAGATGRISEAAEAMASRERWKERGEQTELFSNYKITSAAQQNNRVWCVARERKAVLLAVYFDTIDEDATGSS